MKTFIDEDGDTLDYGYSGRLEMMSNDPSFPGGIPFEGYTFEGSQVVFTDDLFNGQEKNISIDVESEDFIYTNFTEAGHCCIYVSNAAKWLLAVLSFTRCP